MATVASEAHTMGGEDSKAKEYKITNQKYKNEGTFRMGKEITSKLKFFKLADTTHTMACLTV